VKQPNPLTKERRDIKKMKNSKIKISYAPTYTHTLSKEEKEKKEHVDDDKN
jgi:hypothetical protein